MSVSAQSFRIAADPLPGLSIIGRLVDIRVHITKGVPIEGCVRGSRIESACFNTGDPGGRRQTWYILHHVRPVLSSVARDLNIAVIGSDPDYAPAFWRFTNRVDGR